MIVLLTFARIAFDLVVHLETIPWMALRATRLKLAHSRLQEAR